MSRRFSGFCLLALGLGSAASAETVLLTLTGDPAGQFFGAAVAGCGDVDLDGAPDVLCTQADAGGGAGSVAMISGRTRAVLYTCTGDNPGDHFGAAIAGTGDVNGDGHPDFAVGANQYIDWLTSGLGYVRVFSGKDGTELFTVAGEQPGDMFGSAVAGVGDVDGDGAADVFAGALWSDQGAPNAGKAYVFSGKTAELLFSTAGGAYLDYVGHAAAGLGDVDGDGRADFAIGCMGVDPMGVVRVYSGATRGLLYELAGDPVNFPEDFGWSVAAAGDWNQDGIGDLAIGAPGEGFPGFAGRAVVVSGADGVLIHQFAAKPGDESFGFSVAGAGDVDGDGFADLAIGSPLSDGVAVDGGRAYVYSGKTFAKLLQVSGDDFGDAVGGSIAGCGDVNQDGLAEIVAGAWGEDLVGADAGAAYVITAKDCAATWSNHGPGYAGTLGIPGLLPSDDPVLCAPMNLEIGNSRGADTLATAFIGLAPGALPTGFGGVLSVAPPFVALPLALPAAGLALPVTVLCDAMFCGVSVHLQVLEADPGAPHGVAFTRALELVHGG